MKGVISIRTKLAANSQQRENVTTLRERFGIKHGAKSKEKTQHARAVKQQNE
jgi:hypothetical protein